uniref:3-dehydrosphinganine reductase n=1 Tax=Trichobilharzia regenti TaxID=157069 RepID=A0AA85JX70_TRIRE|nr:unnamed protein product [Trichobilharzia regenti]
MIQMNIVMKFVILTIFTATVVLTLYLLLRRRVDFSLCNKSFHGFNVLITGGSSGIGLSLAKLFYKAGANVTIVARDLAKLECAREAIRREKNGNNSVFILSVDLTSNYEVLSEVFSKHVTAHGPIDILINCAGYAVARKFLDTSTSDIEGMLKTNYLSAVYVTRILLPYMLTQKIHQPHEQRIAFICSLASQIGVYGYAAYTGSKYALRGFAEALEMELGHNGPYITLAFPPDTDTPGYALENTGKPAATKEISSTAGLASPDSVAKSIYMDIINGKLVSTYGLEGSLLSWLTAGILPPVSVRCRYLSDFFRVIIGASLEIAAATPLRAVGIFYAFWMKYITYKHNK